MLSQKESSTEEDQEEDVSQINNFKQLFKNEEKFMEQINSLNNRAVGKIKQQKHKDAIKYLQQAEQMLEVFLFLNQIQFAASCGRIIDRNLIVVILYNQACAYQCQWVLEKCSKYLDGVIYNMELAINEDEADLDNLASSHEKESQLVRRYSFLARSYLQYCAILSQLGKHKNALANAKKAAQIMRNLFKVASKFCQEFSQKNDSQGSSSTCQSIPKKTYDSKKVVYYMKDEVEFAKLVVDSSKDTLLEMANQHDLDSMAVNEKQLLREAKKQLYFWRNNPENNEKHLRKELKLQGKEDDYRSILGVQNVQEWIENFNIGSIMHMQPQTHDEFSQYGEMIYEISKRVLLEKIIYLSISYFTIATELRFVELDKAKQMGVSDSDIQTEEFKLSEFYHLKAIEIACKNISCSSPYINHLITSYHKHYNQNLESIQEESICSMTSEINYKEQKLQKLKLVQQQTIRDNKSILEKLNDSSPSARLVQGFQNQPSPIKSNRNASDNVKSNNIIEQMIQAKKKQSDTSPSFQKALNQTQALNNTYKNLNQVNQNDLSAILRKQTLNDVLASTMPIQLQPYKQKTQVQSNKNSQPIKTFVFDKQERPFDFSYSPISSRTNNRSPERIITDRAKQPLNKTPQNRLRTNTVQQANLPLKLETIQQLLKGRVSVQKK
ncbi:hypothetical protein pb186bvf_011119 [Paramecium bursaria]